MRLIKALIAMVAGLVVLLGGAFVLMPTDRIANIAAQQFEVATGRSLHFGGEVKPSLFPVIGATARDVSIGNPEWAGEGPMLVAGEMDMGLNLAALLRGGIIFESIVLQEPRLELRRDAEGRMNWDFARPAPTPATPAEAASGPSRTRGFSLAEARIIGGSLHLEDARSGTDLRIDGLDATLRLPALDGPAQISASGRLNGQSFELTASSDNAQRFMAGGVTQVLFDSTAAGATITFAGRAGLKDLVLEGQLQSNIPALRPFMQLTGHGGGDIAPAYLPLGLNGQITRTADGRIFAREAQFRAGAIRLSGAADLATTGARPRLTGQVTGDVLDLRSADDGGAQHGTQQGWSRAPIDASALGWMDADISLALSGVRTDRTTLGRTRLGVTIDRARAVFDLREVALFGGQLAGEFVMNNRSGLSVGGDLRVRGIDLLPLLTELADYRRIQGEANADLQFLGVGNTLHDIMTSLRGDGRLDFSQGEIIGFDLAGMLRNLDMSYMGEQNRTVYEAITGTFSISDGVLRNDDLLLNASRFSVTGRGSVGLGQRNLDYSIVPSALRGEEGAVLRVPLMITGPWDAPRFRLDMEALAREQLRVDQERLEEIAREEARRLEERARTQAEQRLERNLGVEREEGERIEDALRRRLEQELGNRLRGLLGGD